MPRIRSCIVGRDDATARRNASDEIDLRAVALGTAAYTLFSVELGRMTFGAAEVTTPRDPKKRRGSITIDPRPLFRLGLAIFSVHSLYRDAGTPHVMTNRLPNFLGDSR